MSEYPVTIEFSKDALLDCAKDFCVRTYGPVLGSREPDKWHERYGMLIDFVTELYEYREAK